MHDEMSYSHDSGSERRSEVAAILARAISRSCVPRPARRSPSVTEERTSPSGPVLPLVASSEILSKRSRQGLEVSGETRLVDIR